MFAFRIYRPPTESLAKAAAQHSKTETYLFSSTDPIPTYLDNALALVRETSKLWSLAKGNSTGSYRWIARGNEACARFQAVLLWLSDHLNEKSSSARKSEETEQIEHCLSKTLEKEGRLSTLVTQCRQGEKAYRPGFLMQ
jgi:hypothetical protein